MFKYLVGLIFLFSYSTYSENLSDIISIGIVNTESSSIYISTTANDLHNYKFYICSFHINDCHLIRNNLVSSEINNKAAEDLIGGEKIYTYRYDGYELQEPFGVAILYPKNRNITLTSEHKGQVKIFYKNAEIFLSFCKSQEGIHIYSNDKSFHLYYHFGYEIIPDCSVEVYE